MTSTLAYDVRSAAVAAAVSVETVRRAIHAQAEPYLRAKKLGNKYVIRAADLQAWIDALPDA